MGQKIIIKKGSIYLDKLVIISNHFILANKVAIFIQKIQKELPLP